MNNDIPADLQVAYEFAQPEIKQEIQQEIKQEAAPMNQDEIVMDIDDQPVANAESIESIKIESTTTETMEQDNQQPIVDIKQEVQEEPKQETQNDTLDAVIAGEQKAEGYESSDLELSSDDDESDDDDSSTSDDDEEERPNDPRDNKRQKTMDDEDETFPNGIVKTVHEIIEIVVERPQFEITPTTELIFAGHILQIIDNVVVVQARQGSEYQTLDQGSLLAYEDRTVLGEVFETFGPIVRPFYSIRFNRSDEIDRDRTKAGAPVYYVPSYQKTKIVETEKLKQLKGTDASNLYDEEVDEDEMEFSDDEKEMQYRQRKNKEKKMKKKQNQQQRQPTRPPSGYRDFDSELSAYEQTNTYIPPRQQQSYADII